MYARVDFRLVVCWEVCPLLECPLSEVSLYTITSIYRAIYKVFDLIGHFVLASQGLLGHCTFAMEIVS